MRLETMASAAQILANKAEDLQAELDSITSAWRDLFASWQGVAASAYGPPWEEWHQGATAVASLLSEHSHSLLRSLELMLDHETLAARAFAALNSKSSTL
ncbi:MULTISPECIES: WXG100 family type VII secretion target [unclassified Mycobacterium]|uniref:WXG100 family type VII secretion target n=1 Tax=unclassified Mycobacterium TaxID=2642494 RepID=UPI0021016866|nr:MULTISPECIES: WXG100 family type VII secretion target [unclassified Mycobacterium]